MVHSSFRSGIETPSKFAVLEHFRRNAFSICTFHNRCVLLRFIYAMPCFFSPDWRKNCVESMVKIGISEIHRMYRSEM